MGGFDGINLKLRLEAGSCGEDRAGLSDCRIARTKAGASTGLVISDTYGTRASIGVDYSAGTAGGIDRKDGTDLTAVTATPTSAGLSQAKVGVTIVPVSVTRTVAGWELGIKSDGGEPETGAKFSHTGGKPPATSGAEPPKAQPPEAEPPKPRVVAVFRPYITAGRVPVRPSRGSLVPSINHPFAGTPLGLEIPASFAIQAGLKDLAINNALVVSVEGGVGRGGKEDGQEGKALLVSGRFQLAPKVALLLGGEWAVLGAPAEPEINKFFEGEGSSRIDPAVYAAVKLFGDRLTLYGGHIERTVEYQQFSQMEGVNPERTIERHRTMNYFALTVDPLIWGLRLAFMRGTQEFSEGNPDGLEGRATGELTSLQLSRNLPLGFSASFVTFTQQASGERLEQRMAGSWEQTAVPVNYRDSGFLGMVSWNWEQALFRKKKR